MSASTVFQGFYAVFARSANTLSTEVSPVFRLALITQPHYLVSHPYFTPIYRVLWLTPLVSDVGDLPKSVKLMRTGFFTQLNANSQLFAALAANNSLLRGIVRISSLGSAATISCVRTLRSQGK